MIAADRPRGDPAAERLLVVDGRTNAVSERRAGALDASFRPGDVLVVNDAATLPASLPAWLDGRPIELRLLAAPDDDVVRALLFGAGDWRTPTEHRPPPPAVSLGDSLAIGPELRAEVISVGGRGRFLTLRFDREGARLWSALYALGRPVQYAYLAEDLRLWDVQNRYAGRPWAVEMPSAGHVLDWALLERLRARGVSVVALTHGAGLSSTGDDALDRLLPLPERYDLPARTVAAVTEARARGGRVIAAGTSVVRALEGNVARNRGTLVPGEDTTDLRIDRSHRLLVVNGVLTGMHELGASHRDLLDAFAPPALLAEGYALAETRGFLGHEFGDVCLVLAA